MNKIYIILSLFGPMTLALFALEGQAPAVQTPTAQSKDKEFLIINGGGSPTMNYEFHENDIKSFNSTLFNNQATIFNAAGNQTQVVKFLNNGRGIYFERDELGLVKLSQSTFRGGRPESASTENISKYFMKLSSRNPKQLTVIYGDHGTPDGVATWKNTVMSAKEIQNNYNKLSPSTLIRAVHVHCFAGAAMVDPKRKVPSSKDFDSKKVFSFLSDNYKTNRCALGVSAHDEVYFYYTDLNQNSGNAYKSSWQRILKKKGKTSLTELKNSLIQFPDFSSTPKPVLTSDYFLNDLEKSLCPSNFEDEATAIANVQEESTNPSQTCSIENGQQVCPQIRQIQPQIEFMSKGVKAGQNSALCRNLKQTTFRQELAHMDFFVKKDHEALSELGNYNSQIAIKNMKKDYPKLYQAILQELKKNQALVAELALLPPPEESDRGFQEKSQSNRAENKITGSKAPLHF